MTEQEKQELKQEIITQIESESQDVTELEQVSSLDGINTLPAMRGTTLVIAPVNLLGKPATDAASLALAAAQKANTAKEATEQATQAAEAVVERVERSVRLSELGSYFTSGEFMDCVRSGDVSVYGRWKVRDVYGGIDVVVGVVDVFVDSMLHCLTQRLLTNMVVSDSGEFDGSHKHSLHEFYRLYNLSWTEEKLPDGSSWPLNSWSAWKDDLSGVLSSVEELRERMLSAEDKLSVMSVGDHVVMFGGFCSGDVLPNSSPHSGSDEGVSVMWNVTCGRFVLYVEGLGVSSDLHQYMNWSDASRYGSENSDSGWLPFSDRLYIDESSNTLYYFRDGEIRALSGGGGVVDDDESISDDEIVGMF